MHRAASSHLACQSELLAVLIVPSVGLGHGAVIPPATSIKKLYSPFSEKYTDLAEVFGFILVGVADFLLLLLKFKIEHTTQACGHKDLRRRTHKARCIYIVSDLLLVGALAVLLAVSNFEAVLAVILNLTILVIAGQKARRIDRVLRCLSHEFDIGELIIEKRNEINAKLGKHYGLDGRNAIQDWGVYSKMDGVRTSLPSILKLAQCKKDISYSDEFKIVDRIIVDHVVLSWKGTTVSVSDQNVEGLGPIYLTLCIRASSMERAKFPYPLRARNMKDYWKQMDPYLDTIERERIVHAFIAAWSTYKDVDLDNIWNILLEWSEKQLRIDQLLGLDLKFSVEGKRKLLLMVIANIDRYVVPTLQVYSVLDAKGANGLLPGVGDVIAGMWMIESLFYLREERRDQELLALVAARNASLDCRVHDLARRLPDCKKSIEDEKIIRHEVSELIREAKCSHWDFVENLKLNAGKLTWEHIEMVGRVCEDYTVMAALVRVYGMLDTTLLCQKFGIPPRRSEGGPGSILDHTFSVIDLLVLRLTQGTWLESIQRNSRGCWVSQC